MEKQQNKIPEIRFPEFDGEWEFMHGNELFERISNKNHNSDLPILAISQEFGAIPRHLINYKISVTEKSVSSYKVVEKGDFIISLRSFQGGIEYSNYKGICSPAYIILRPTIELEAVFFKSHFKSFRYIQQLQSKLEGIRDGKMISYKYFSEIRLPFPTLPEQQKIAHFFSITDKKLTQLQEKKTALELYKKGMMQQIFSQKLRFKDDNGKDFPEWKFKKLGTVTYKVGKKNKDNINYPVYSINNNKGFVPQAEQFEDLNSTERGYDISMYKIVNENTFAYNPARINVGSLGYSYDLNKVIVSSLYVCFKANEELDDLYMLRYFDTYKFNTDILRFEEGGVRKYLFYDNFSKLTIPIPCKKEQTKIANFLSKIDDKINTVTEKIEQTKAYKKGLLQKMFCN